MDLTIYKRSKYFGFSYNKQMESVYPWRRKKRPTSYNDVNNDFFWRATQLYFAQLPAVAYDIDARPPRPLNGKLRLNYLPSGWGDLRLK